MKRSVIQERMGSDVEIPDSTPFHPGYRLFMVKGVRSMNIRAEPRETQNSER